MMTTHGSMPVPQPSVQIRVVCSLNGAFTVFLSLADGKKPSSWEALPLVNNGNRDLHDRMADTLQHLPCIDALDPTAAWAGRESAGHVVGVPGADPGSAVPWGLLLISG